MEAVQIRRQRDSLGLCPLVFSLCCVVLFGICLTGLEFLFFPSSLSVSSPGVFGLVD